MSYAEVDGDASEADSDEVENIRVQSVATSEKTGRVVGKRKTHRHLREDLLKPQHEEPHAVEEVGGPADTKPTESKPANVGAKRKRTRIRIVKENDSVSFVPINKWV